MLALCNYATILKHLTRKPDVENLRETADCAAVGMGVNKHHGKRKKASGFSRTDRSAPGSYAAPTDRVVRSDADRLSDLSKRLKRINRILGKAIAGAIQRYDEGRG